MFIFVYSVNNKLQCANDEFCVSNLTNQYFCNEKTNLCEHQSLSEFTTPYIIGIILIIFISAFANAGGIGGGSVIVPVLTILFAFEVNEAIPLSKATIFAGAVINVFFLLDQRNEFDINKSLIDYRLCAFMLPIMMCGTFFGVYLNFIVPPMIIILLLTGYLMLSIFSLNKKYKIITEKEDKKLGTTLSKQIKEKWRNFTNSFNKKKEDEIEIMQVETSNSKSELISQDNLNERETKTANDNVNEFTDNFNCDESEESIQKNMSVKNERSTYAESGLTGDKIAEQVKKISFKELMRENMKFILILIASIIIIMSLSLFKEGVFFGETTEISRCSALGITVMIIIALFCLVVSSLAFIFNIRKDREELKSKLEIPCKILDNEKSINIVDMENELADCKDNIVNIEDQFSQKSDSIVSVLTHDQIETNIKNEIKKKKVGLYKLGIVSFIAGVGAGLLGIGGGMIINPFLILMNYSPMDASAISSMGVLFTSTISSSEFLIMGAIKLSDLNYFLVFAGIGSLSGVFIIKGLIEKFQRQSILLLIILGIFIFAVIVLPGFGLLTIPIQNYFKFGNVCLQ